MSAERTVPAPSPAPHVKKRLAAAPPGPLDRTLGSQEFISLADAARFLGVSVGSLRRLAQVGHLPFVARGGQLLLRRKAVEELGALLLDLAFDAHVRRTGRSFPISRRRS